MSELKTTEFVFIRLDELNDMRADLRALDELRAENVSLLDALRVERANTSTAIQGMAERFAVLDDATEALCKENAKLKVKLQDALDARADYLEKANELNTKWGSVPWDALYDPSEAHNRYDIEQWYDANAPQSQK